MLYALNMPTLLRLVLLLALPGWSALVMARDWQSPLLRDHPLTGVIIETRSGERLSESQLLARLTPMSYVLIGEKHDNADHHQIEAWLLAALLAGDDQADPPTAQAVVFEMLDEAQQPALDRLAPTDSLESMQAALAWPAHGWDWAVYGPLIKQALILRATVLAGNVANPLLKAVYQRGADALQGARFDTLSSLTPAQQADIQQQIFESHCQLMPFERLAPMVTAQAARDASMAHALSAAPYRQAILLAGGFHVDKRLGVPVHLRGRSPDASVSVVMLVEVSAGAEASGDYALDAAADYIWFTPKATDVDYCESLRQQHKSGRPGS